MYIGNRYYKKGTRVLINGIVDPGPLNQDADLNGKTGTLTRKFDDIPFGDIGVYLDIEPRPGVSNRANLKAGDFQVIEEK